MWRLVEKLLQVLLLMASASAVFVVGAVLVSALRPPLPSPDAVDPDDALIELRLTAQGVETTVFVGQPLVIDLTLVNLESRRARNQTQLDPKGAAETAEIILDVADNRETADARPWERQLSVSVLTPGGARVLTTLDWHARLLNPGVEATERRLALAPVRTTLILNGEDLATLLPGPYVIQAALPSTIAPPARVLVIPLEFELVPAPTTDTDRAVVSLAVARVAAIRGEPTESIEAALTALALDPLQDEALMIVAEGWEQQGEIERALEWYARYLETLSDTDSEERRTLEQYVGALRRQG